MRWIITGSTGFIGASLTEFLTASGEHVFGIAKPAYPVSVLSLASLITSENPDFIFHAAGSASVEDSWRDPSKDFHDSVILWQSLLEATRLSGLKPKLFFPSSAAVFGSPAHLPISEAESCHPISPYGFHKLICEQLAHEYASLTKIPIVICRIFSVFGPRQKRLLIWELVDQLMRDDRESIILKGSGMEERDYLSIQDVVTAIHALSMSRQSIEIQDFNFGSGKSFQVMEIIHMLERMIGKQKPAVHIPTFSIPLGNPFRWRADNSRLKLEIPDWKAAPIEESLDSCLRSWKQACPE